MMLNSVFGKLTLRQRLIAIIFLVSTIASTIGFLTTAARDLRDAVRAARADVESQISSGSQASTPVVLAASIARLGELLNPPPPTA